MSNAWVTCPVHTDNIPKGMLIRDNIRNSHVFLIKAPAVQDVKAEIGGSNPLQATMIVTGQAIAWPVLYFWSGCGDSNR